MKLKKIPIKKYKKPILKIKLKKIKKPILGQLPWHRWPTCLGL
jgi:hypothetical protein